MPRRSVHLFAVLALLVAGGIYSCAPKEVGVPTLNPDYQQIRPRTVAVLPFDNMSTDLDATPLIRPIVNERLRAKGFQMKDLAEVDQVLQENGVLISHDVYAFTPEELGEMLQTDAVMFGTVTDFNTKYVVLYSSVSVGIKLELTDCRTGEALWQDNARSSRNTLIETLLILLLEEDKTRALIAAAAYNTAFAVLKSYRPYAEDAARLMLASLPPGPLGLRPYAWDLDPAWAAGDAVEIWIGLHHGIVTVAPSATFQIHRP